LYSNDDSESTFQPIPTQKKTRRQVKKKVISEDDLLQPEARKSLSAEDANRDLDSDRIDWSLQKRSSKAQEVKKTSHGNRHNLLILLPHRHVKTRPNLLPQAWMTLGRLPSLGKLRKLRRPKATSRLLRRLPGVLLQM
jgi:hypothetical protein